MIYFNCDYTEGAHPAILEALQRTNLEQTVGYGEDAYCNEARSLIKKACENPDVDVHFLVGGTQANLTVISAALRPHQGVIAANTGHINVHETGAIEATGHKVLALPSDRSGKLTADQVEALNKSHVEDSTFEHMVQPKMVYLSDSTENGAVYTKAELEAISAVCRTYGLYLFLDGARLGYALESPKNDLTLSDLTRLCDVFYIGGTKVGALFGEAVVIANPALKTDFRYFIKQKGGMLAKGRLLGIQFLTLFRDNLYFTVSRHAIQMAQRIAEGLQELSIPFLTQPESNQIFPIFENSVLRQLEEKYMFAFWEKIEDNCSAVRICTSWATTEENVAALLRDIRKTIGR